MRRTIRRKSRLALFAVLAALPVMGLGLVLAAGYRTQTRSRERALLTLAPLPATAGPGAPEGLGTPGGGAMTRAMSLQRSTEMAALRADADSLRELERKLAIGLGGLYLALIILLAIGDARLRREAARTAFLADHDQLTGLPNRVAFVRRAARRLAQPHAACAVALIDLDRFGQINDALGQRVGDLLLCRMAERLREGLRPGDLIARTGGDEFGLMLCDASDATDRLTELRRRLGEEHAVAGITVGVSASVGWALAPEDGDDVDDLLRRATAARDHARSRRRGVGRWGAALARDDSANLALAAELGGAIAADELVLDYQPQVDPHTGVVRALEALVRWEHPQLGRLPPDRFLPLAEQTDDIGPLTAWVLRRALRDLRELAPGDDGPRMAVNVSARSLSSGELAGEVLAALAESAVSPARLILEVTETAILTDPERAAGELARLAAAGVRISLDDFGCGQTSIGHFARLPLDELKIDRSFVGTMASEPVRAAIVRSLVELGHNLGLEVVAEGVEDEAALALLRATGVELVQGYLMSRPLPFAAIADWLSSRAGRPLTPAGQSRAENSTLAR